MRVLLNSLLAVCLPLIAVGTVVGQAHFGLRGAPTIGYLGGSYIEDGGGGEWGIELGLTADVHLFANVDLVTGILFLHQKGGRKIKTVDSDTIWGYRFGYMYIPLVVRPVFPLGESGWNLGPFVGIYFGLNGSCKIKDAQYTGFSTTCSDDTVGGAGESTDYGIPVGLDFIRKFEGGSQWLLYARMDVGLANVLQGADDLGLTTVHRTIVIGFGFTYPLY